VSFFKRLFGKNDHPRAEEEQQSVGAEPLGHFAIITTPAPAPAPPPVVEEEPLPEPQPTVESPALTLDDEPVAETEPAVEEPVAEAPSPPEPDTPIEVGRMSEAAVLEALEQALDELGSAHHRPFSRG